MYVKQEVIKNEKSPIAFLFADAFIVVAKLYPQLTSSLDREVTLFYWITAHVGPHTIESLSWDKNRFVQAGFLVYGCKNWTRS